jgi:hypothetical protein
MSWADHTGTNPVSTKVKMQVKNNVAFAVTPSAAGYACAAMGKRKNGGEEGRERTRAREITRERERERKEGGGGGSALVATPSRLW